MAGEPKNQPSGRFFGINKYTLPYQTGHGPVRPALLRRARRTTEAGIKDIKQRNFLICEEQDQAAHKLIVRKRTQLRLETLRILDISDSVDEPPLYLARALAAFPLSRFPALLSARRLRRLSLAGHGPWDQPHNRGNVRVCCKKGA